MNYVLREANKEGTLLRPQHTSYSDEYAQRMSDLHLKDEVARGENGHYKKFYRLYANHPHFADEALAYDIQCPSCGHIMKQIGRQIDANKLGLYSCPCCNR